MEGIIAISETSNNLICIGAISTQINLKLLPADIKKFKLKKGDRVQYAAWSYSIIQIIKKI